jgi:hypothetical protein
VATIAKVIRSGEPRVCGKRADAQSDICSRTMETQISNSEQPELLTIAESAVILRCSKAHVSNLIAGKIPGVPCLPYVPLGRRKLIRRSALARWMEIAEVTHQ